MNDWFTLQTMGIPQEQIDAYEKAQEFAFAVIGVGPVSSDYWSSRIAERASSHGNTRKETSDPHTCQYCQKLVIDPGQPLHPAYAMNKHSSVKRIVFDCSPGDMEAGYLAGCSLLARLWAETEMPTEEEQREDIYRLTADIYMQDSTDSFGFTGLSNLRLLNVEYPWKTPRKDFTSEEQALTLAGTYFEVYTEPDDPGAYVVGNRSILENPAGDIFMQEVKCALERSIEVQRALHEDLLHASTMPTRLMRVAKVNGYWDMRLEEVNDIHVEYCTLSYCWGLEPSGLTTSANIQQRYSKLNFDELPKTIQDAAIVVEKLGFGYLWADSICIIQEPEDKAKEITRMAGIYGNSVLTICASRALTVEEGFLYPRTHFEPGSQTYKLPFKLPTNKGTGTVIVGKPMTSIGENRLQSRAWAYQERIMARRILDFDDQATSIRWWESDGEVRARDGGPLNHAYHWYSTDSTRARDFGLQHDYSCTRNMQDKHLMHDWTLRVNEYTSLGVTLPTDRMLAIASVAEKVAKLTGRTYLAGLWLEHLPWSLMWSMSDRPVRLPRPSTYQGPSWSWTGVNGKVHGYFPVHLIDGGAQLKCEIAGYEIDPVYDIAPYGSLRSATLVVQANSRRARWVRSDKVKGSGDYDYLAYRPRHRPILGTSQKAHDTKGLLLEPELSIDLAYTPKDLLPAKLYPDALEPEFSKTIEEGGQGHLDIILLEMFRHEGEILGLAIREPEEGVCQRLGIFTTCQGQNHRYTTDDRDHDIVKAKNNNTDEEDGDGNVGDLAELDLMAETKQLGSAWEKEIRDKIEEREQKRQEKRDWKNCISWFEKEQGEAQVFVIV